MPALGLEFERVLHARPADVRREVAAALQQAGFQVTAEQLTRIEAKRGSRIFGGALMPARMLPMLASFDITSDSAGCALAGRFADQHLNLGGKAWGWNQSYRGLFAEALATVDRALARLDPEGAAAFPEARFWTKGGEVAVLEQAQTFGAQAGTAVFDKANELLEGGPRERGPVAWKGVDSVTLAGAWGSAVLSLVETQAHLGVGMMIVTRRGSLPANLTRDVEQLASRVEGALMGAPGRAVAIALADEERPVVEFLHQQVRIRDGLPVRTLHTCRTCHFQKVTNEDFARLQLRNQRLRTLVGGVGATITGGSIQPFVVLGQLFRLKTLDPDYVCPRCQGLDAEEQVITFCPSCGEMRSEAVLRTCRKCRHDFRSGLAPETLWLSAEAAAALVAPPPDAVPAWPGTGAAGPAWPGTGPALPPPAGPAWPGTGVAGAPPSVAPPAGPAWPAPPPPPPGMAAAPGGWVTASVPGTGPVAGWPAPPQSNVPPPVAPPRPAPGGWVAPAPAWPAPPPPPPVQSVLAPPPAPSGPPAGSIPAAEAPPACPGCGAPVGPAFAFCPGCGRRLDPPAASAGPPPG